MIFIIKEKWQQFLSSHLKETSKLHLEVYYRILTLTLFRDLFWLEILSCPPSCIVHTLQVGHAISFSYTKQ